MGTFALINTRIASPIIRRQDFDTAPQLAEEKGLKWIPDSPPAFNSKKETRTQTSPVPVDAEEVPYVVSDIPLDDIKAKRKAEATAKRKAVVSAGVVVGESVVTADDTDQSKMTGAVVSLDKGYITAPLKWKASDTFVSIDAATLDAIGEAVAQKVEAGYAREAALWTAIDACDTADEVLAVDLTEGWPS